MSSAVSRSSAKAESATKGGGSKPNAWSKPLQPTKTSSGSNSSSAKRFTNSNKQPGPNAPPGLTTPPTGTTSTSNGTSTVVNRFHQNNNNGSSNSNNEESNAIALRERFLHLLLTVTGQSVTVSLKSGATYTGVLHTATPFAHLPEAHRFKYVLKAVTSSPHDASVEGKTLLLNMKEVMQLQIKSCRLDSLVVPAKGVSNSDGAFTDTEISGAGAAAATVMSRGKDLVSAGSHWTSEPIVSSGATTSSILKTNSRAGALKGNIADWDQFKANEELFNVTANYDETVYTTPLNHSNISREDQLRAAELARAIESSVTTNMHLAEERGHVLSQDYDEEDRYSGVLKSNTAATASIAPAPTKPTPTVAATKLNYAAVAKTRPPGFGGDNKAAAIAKIEPKGEISAPKEKVEETVPPVLSEPVPTAITKETETKEEASPSPSATPATSAAEEQAKKEQVSSTPETKAEGEEEEQQEAPKSKLNVNAKEFSFNINAKTFTPGMPSGMIPPPPPPQPQYIDPNTGYPMMPMHLPHGMMQVMMGHPGAFPGMRYPQYPGMEQMQHMPQHQHMHGPPAPPPPLPVSSASPSAATSGATSPAPISDEGSISQQALRQPQDADAASETSSQAASQQHPPQPSPPPPPPPPQHGHQVPMYMQQGYYPGGQIMHPGHLPQQFMHPVQLAAMQHQQRQMGYPIQPGHMPPNMMRAPNGMPYYAGPGGPMPYPPPYAGPYGEDPNLDGGMNAYGGRGGRGGTGGRLGRGGARQGRGPRSMGRVGGVGRVGVGGRLYQQQQPSGGYSSSNNSSQPGSGRQTPQQQQQQPHPPQPGYEHPPPASQPPQHETDPPVPEASAVEE